MFRDLKESMRKSLKGHCENKKKKVLYEIMKRFQDKKLEFKQLRKTQICIKLKKHDVK